ncbi:MAG: hypothetical protein DBX00_03700 [Verrucomicrobia bacterium]|nr:MAG: hypothetical protein DBX00_03700 [Verrucomicrobiota bacterium]
MLIYLFDRGFRNSASHKITQIGRYELLPLPDPRAPTATRKENHHGYRENAHERPFHPHVGRATHL